ncbi:MAG TPA: CDP-archaeol synthase [Rhizomicrobium sp.]|nr:CDP-archaeol synthase [Rhizomicrobium sp.]
MLFDRINLALDLKVLVLVSVANAAPVIAQDIFGRSLSYPVDGRAMFFDAQPLLGASKSVRGLVSSLLATTLVAPIVGLSWLAGALIGAAAMLGDLCSSFIKRRMKLPPSSMTTGLDQIPESLFPLLACAAFLPLSVTDIAIVVACFGAGEVFGSRFLHRIRLRDRPY